MMKRRIPSRRARTSRSRNFIGSASHREWFEDQFISQYIFILFSSGETILGGLRNLCSLNAGILWQRGFSSSGFLASAMLVPVGALTESHEPAEDYHRRCWQATRSRFARQNRHWLSLHLFLVQVSGA